MPPLFRYFSERDAFAFIEHGEVLLRPLSYFRDYEDEGVRADTYEGTLVHLPEDGLRIKFTNTGEEAQIPYTFESSAQEENIFVYCMSTELNSDIAQRFKADVAVEIIHPVKFMACMRSAISLRKRLRVTQLVYGEVKYYEKHEPPIVDWALPEKIAMRKPKVFAWQKEYRFAIPVGNAFGVENVEVKLVAIDSHRSQRAQSHASILLKLGCLSKICKLHRF